MIHGLASSGETWATAAQRLQQEYNVTVTRPNLPSLSDFETQARSLITQIAGVDGSAIAIGHSNGGIVARQANIDGRPWNGLITVATPHLGAPLAANVLNGNVFEEGRYIVNSIAAPFNFYSQFYPDEWGWDIAAAFGHFAYSIGATMPAVAFAVGFGGSYTVLPQMVPGSNFLTTINGAANVDRESAAIPRRYNIVSSVTNSWGNYWHGVSPGNYLALTAGQYAAGIAFYFAGEYYSFYDDYNDPNWYPKQLYAFLWFDAADAMFTIDQNWCALIGAADGNYRCTANDGILPTNVQFEPNSTQAITIFGPSHQEETSDNAVYDQIAQKLRDSFGVGAAGPGGGGGGGGMSYTATITGQTEVQPDASCLFSASTDLPDPISYLWTVNGVRQSGSSSEIRISNSGPNYTLAVTVHDAGGQTATDDQIVSVSASAPECLDQ